MGIQTRPKGRQPMGGCANSVYQQMSKTTSHIDFTCKFAKMAVQQLLNLTYILLFLAFTYDIQQIWKMLSICCLLAGENVVTWRKDQGQI